MTLFPLLMHLKCQKTHHTPDIADLAGSKGNQCQCSNLKKNWQIISHLRKDVDEDGVSIFQHGETSSGQNDFLTICQYLASTTQKEL